MSTVMVRFAIATFWAPARATPGGPPPPPYHRLCVPTPSAGSAGTAPHLPSTTEESAERTLAIRRQPATLGPASPDRRSQEPAHARRSRRPLGSPLPS